VLAFLVWFSINVTERDAERVVELPLSVRKVQPGLIVTNPPVKPVAVTLHGPRTFLDGVDEHRARVALDLGGSGPGDVRVELTPDMVKPELPRRLKVVRMEPPRVKLRVERVIRRTLPVHADLAGSPAFGYTVAESHVVPERIEVTGPATKVDELKEIMTEPLDLRGLKETVERTVPLAWAGDFINFAPDHVTVALTFEESMVSRQFDGVPVGVLNGDKVQAQLTPVTVDLTVRGPARVLHNFKMPDGAVYVDAGGLPPGNHRVTPRVDLPGGLEVKQVQPEALTLQIPAAKGKR